VKVLALVWVATLWAGLAAAEPRVVARVAGPRGEFVIDAGRLDAYLAAHPGKEARAGLQDLIDFELLAAEAAAAGVGEAGAGATGTVDRRVEAAADRVLVALWLDRIFAPQWTAEAMPEALVRQSYEANRGFFDHPELRVADHILVTTPEAKRPVGELDATARAFAERIHREVTAAAPVDRAAFRALGERYVGEAPAGLEVRVQDLRRFARKGQYVAEFGEGAFAISRAGEVGAPFVTEFGWHVVRIDAIEPEQRQSFDEVEAELRVRIVPEVRQTQFMSATDALAEALPKLRAVPGVRALLNTLPLDALAARRGLGDEGPAVEGR
jgi:hypothetical protein